MWKQSVVRLIYPPQCVACDSFLEDEGGLCPTCWRGVDFIRGVICDCCGTPLPGDDPSEVAHCDECLQTIRPWQQGRAAFAYGEVGRRLVLGLKHADRTELAGPAARWMVAAMSGMRLQDPILVPIPLHWTRLLRRRYNQAALLAYRIGALKGWQVCPDALIRKRATKPLEGHSRDERFAALDAAITPHPRRKVLSGRQVVLIDDVMTSGATLDAAARACLQGGAAHVSIVTLARVVKDR